MPPLLMRLQRQRPGASGPIDGILVPTVPRPSPLPDPLLVRQTAGMPLESVASIRATISLVGTTLATQTNVVSNPAGVENGDLILIQVCDYIGDVVGLSSIPAGFTEIDAGLVWRQTGDCKSRVFYKVASGEPTSYTFGTGAGAASYCLLSVWRGVDPGSPINALSGSRPQFVNQISDPGVTTTRDGCMILNMADIRTGSSFVVPSVVAPDDGSAWTLAYDVRDGGAATRGDLAYRLQRAGATGRSAWDTNDPPNSQENAVRTIALTPRESALSRLPFETLQGVRQLSNGIIEAGGSAGQILTVWWESLGGIKSSAGSGTFPWESVQKLAILGNIPFESLAVVLAPGSVFSYEHLLGVRATLSTPWEALSGVRATIGAPVEWRGWVAGLGGAPFESLVALKQTFSAAYEYLQGVRALLGAPVESLMSLAISRSAPIESLAVVSKVTGAPFESLQRLALSAALPFESLKGIRVTAALPVETLALLRALVSPSYENLGGARSLGTFPWESVRVGSFAASQTASIPIEWTQVARATAGLPLDVRTGLPGLRLHLSEAERAPGLVLVEYVEERLDETGGLVMVEVAKAGLTMSESAPIT